MGFLDSIWGKDYSEVLETGLSDPQSGEALFVAIHNEGRGADVLQESELPDVSEVGDFASFAADAQKNMSIAMQDMGGQILSMALQMDRQSPEVSALMRSGQINVYNEPGVEDIQSFDEALETISKEASRLSLDSEDGSEFEAVMGSIANDAWALREEVNSVLDSTGFSVLNSATAQLTEMGIPESSIQAAMTPDPVINQQQFNPAAPLMP